jgi:hypothetical protein
MYLRITRGSFDPARFDEVNALIPAVLARLRELPGYLDERVGVDRSAGTSIIASTFDTPEHAQFARDSLGDALVRIQAASWQGEAPELYEVVR